MILNKRNLLCFEDYIFGEELLSIITASFKMESPGIQHAGLFYIQTLKFDITKNYLYLCNIKIRNKVITTKNKDMKTIIEKTVEGFENAIISENEESWFVDLRTGLGEAEYPKCDYTLDQAIDDQVNWRME